MDYISLKQVEKERKNKHNMASATLFEATLLLNPPLSGRNVRLERLKERCDV